MAWKLKRNKSVEDEPKTKGLKQSDDEDSAEQFEHKPGAFEPVANEYDPDFSTQDRTVMLLNDEDFLPGLIPSLAGGSASEHDLKNGHDLDHVPSEASAQNGEDEEPDYFASAILSADDAVNSLHAAKHGDLDVSPVDENELNDSNGEWDLDAFAPYQPPAYPASPESEPHALDPVHVIDTLSSPTSASKLVVRLGQFSASYEVAKSEVTIGRPDPRMDVFPDVAIEWDDAVSRNHARVLHKTDGDYVEDTGSTNGTKLNDKPLNSNKPYLLKDGDRIQLGEKTQITYVR